MERQAQHDLQILTELSRGEVVTQRNLAKKLGIALGLANLYIKRLARKGYIKVSSLPPKRIRYLVTPTGILEKSRLTYEYMDYSLQLYRHTRTTLRSGFAAVAHQGHRRVVIYGTGEPAELAYLTMRELGLDVVGVFNAESPGQRLFDLPVMGIADLQRTEIDLIIIATFADADDVTAALTLQGVPREKILSLREAS